jgi:pre-60S factor REI1
MNDLGELVLASGGVVGHRSLARYYKQNLRPSRGGGALISSDAIHTLVSKYRKLAGAQGGEQQKHRMTQGERRAQRTALRAAMNANKQKHFRIQNSLGATD